MSRPNLDRNQAGIKLKIPYPAEPRVPYTRVSPTEFLRRQAPQKLLIRFSLARQTNVSVAKLTAWRDRALAGAVTALKERERGDHHDDIARLKSKVGEITMDNELLNAKIAALEGKRPLAPRFETMSQTALALPCSRLWLGARWAWCQRLSLPQRGAPPSDRPSPWPPPYCVFIRLPACGFL